MKKREIKNYGRSVKDRLLTVSKESGIPYMTILVRYIQERLLYRVAQSEYRSNFFLKGGALLYAINQEKARPTKDIDFLATRINNEGEYIRFIFAQIVTVSCEEDGILFDSDSIGVEDITQDKEYHGLRLTILASLDTVRQSISMDIGFGDIVTPGPQDLQYPLLLEDVPSMSVLAYSLETVVAEKFEAMISLSVNNSRMKDFFDVYTILKSGKVDAAVLEDAVREVMANRGTAYIKGHPLFEAEFAASEQRQTMWRAFLRKMKYPVALEFGEVMEVITSELKPMWERLAEQRTQ